MAAIPPIRLPPFVSELAWYVYAPGDEVLHWAKATRRGKAHTAYGLDQLWVVWDGGQPAKYLHRADAGEWVWNHDDNPEVLFTTGELAPFMPTLLLHQAKRRYEGRIDPEALYVRAGHPSHQGVD
jgi:hypothetical protein